MSEVLTETGKVISSVENLNIKLDRQIKKVLACKPILAAILAEVVDECKGMSREEVEACIEGEVVVERVIIDPGFAGTEIITGDATDDAVIGEGLVKYDIRTHLMLPKDTPIKILVDVEAQKDDNPGYDIPVRSLFYCARMISSQLGTEFSNSSSDRVKYGNIKKVYSIWICMETSEKKANTIERYRITRDLIAGKEFETDERYDILESIIINISKKHTKDGENGLLDTLNDLLNENLKAKDKLKVLSDYGIPVTEDMEEEVSTMCSYTAAVIEKGLEKGKTEGMAQGRAEGRAETLSAIKEAVRALKSGSSFEEVSSVYGEDTALVAKDIMM